MEIRVINPAEVVELLPMVECIEVVAKAMRCASRGDALMPLRTKMDLPGGEGFMGMMPGYMAAPRVFGMKLITVFEGNFSLGMQSHNGLVILFNCEHGRPFAVVDASEITAIRTAAASAFATDLLARKDARSLAVLGYGIQARQHIESMLCVREISKIRVWGRSLGKAQAFADEMGAKFGVKIHATESVREAIAGIDIICTVTGSAEPILLGEWLEEGQHVNAVGASLPGRRELDTAAVVCSRMYVDLREGAIAQAGEFQMARDEGAIDEDHILGEVGELALGRVQGRTNDRDITLFKSLGLILQDLAAAHYVYEKAKEMDAGVVADF